LYVTIPDVELYARTNGELLFGPVIPDKTRLLVAAIARLLLALMEIEPYCIGTVACTWAVGIPMMNTPSLPAKGIEFAFAPLPPPEPVLATAELPPPLFIAPTPPIVTPPATPPAPPVPV
jgi:hypothetical protein